jgi:uncharacterized protein (TIGR02611 family)
MLSILRKVGIASLGGAVLVVGLILVPLPGPGFLVCLLGLMILALEFQSAQSQVDRLKAYLKKISEKAKQR